ncbi:phage tail sheath family protein [Enterobacter ludwigii]
MTTVTTVPGIYIEEEASPAISVSQGATSVPLFIAKFSPIETKNNGVMIRISSWLYFCQTFSTAGNSAATALQLYFQNGGGACYVFTLADSTDQDILDTLPALADETGEITLFVVPENDTAYRNVVYGTLLPLLEQNKGYFLLADSPDGKVPSGLGASAHAAVYYPALSITASQTQGDAVQVLASAPMAGIYCTTDRERGVWKAPANVVLKGVSDVSVRVTDDVQGEMNLVGVNVIRYFSDRGVVVWGARTLLDDDNWRYIPVRRLFDAAERDIKNALRPMVFEPNNQITWKRVQSAIDHYLYRLWQQGGLAGNRAGEAYYIRIGKDITMTQEDINQGKMIVQVGMAAVRPAEFIILQFTQDMVR